MKNALIIIIVFFVLGLVVATAGLVMGASSSLSSASAGVLRSEDDGANWSVTPDIYKSEIESLLIGGDGRIYAGTRRDGLWVSNFTGDKWQQVSAHGFESGTRVFDITVNGDQVLVTTFSDNRGHVWELQGIANRPSVEKQTIVASSRELYFTPLSQYAVFGVARDPADYRVIRMISTDGGFYESVDGGANWKSVFRFDDGLTKLIDDGSSSGRFWVVTSRGNIYFSTNAGRNWIDVTGGLREYAGAREIESTFFDRSSGALYLGTGYGLMRSYDNGINWQPVALTVPPEVLPVTAVAVSPNDSRHIFVAAKNQLYVSDDNGASWHGSILPTNRVASTIVIDSQNSNNILIGLRR